jgi:hypothetical protein
MSSHVELENESLSVEYIFFMFDSSKHLHPVLFQVKMTRQKYVINAKRLDIFLAIAQKSHLRWTEMMAALVEAETLWVPILLLLVETVPWTKKMFKKLVMKRKKS